jgi:RND family efflux transporter MFP subunit
VLWVSRYATGSFRTAAALVLLSCLAAGACRRNDPQEATTTNTIVVTGQPARLETMREVISLPGLVVPSAAADHTVVVAEPAQIVELPRAEGDLVQAGDLLVRFDIASITADVQARQLEMAEATSRLERAKAEATRLTSLNERGLIARNQLDAAQSAVSAAETAVNQAKLHVDSAGALVERTIVRARFPGRVVKVWHKAGESVLGGTNDPILRVIDPTRLQVSGQASLSQLERVQPGLTATIQVIGGATETATVAFRQAPEPGGSSGDVRINFAGPTTLAVDTPVRIEIMVEERRDAVVVPQQALQTDAGASWVWVAGDDGAAHRRDVRVGLTANGLVQIASGVAVGEKIILTGIAELAEGTPIVFKST